LRDRSFLEDIESLDNCYVDGVGAQLAELLMYRRWLARTTADLFIRDVWRLAAARGLRVAMVGGGDGVARRATILLRSTAPVEPVLTRDGQLGSLDEVGFAALIAESKPDLVLLGLGQPLQERVAVHIARHHPTAVVLCIGGLFDILRQHPARPTWIRRAGLEWAVRLAEQPRAMWRRYLLGPPETVSRILHAQVRGSRHPVHDGSGMPPHARP
jgi:N-acetylglucosaminyldiphosphoundecaprenol N-acetyl-beta-D-mannosaminyltransferase